MHCIILLRQTTLSAAFVVFSGHKVEVPYFFGYKMGFFSFQNNTEDLDPSYKTDLDLWYCLGMGKIGIKARFHRTDLIN